MGTSLGSKMQDVLCLGRSNYRVSNIARRFYIDSGKRLLEIEKASSIS